jgi:GTP-binding protein HflX
MRTLTNADVLVEDKLFATLDPTTRMYQFPSGEQFLFVDTVGFIRNIPHGLVESFKATLEETHQADVLLHIADASAPDLASQIDAVHSVLKELDSDDNPQLLVLNKIDLLSLPAKEELKEKYPNAAFISAQKKSGIDDLFEKLKEKITFKRKRTKLRLPPHKSQLLSKLHEQGKVLATEYLEDAILVEAFVPESLIAATRKYKVKSEE